jgi:hypothetical protein
MRMRRRLRGWRRLLLRGRAIQVGHRRLAPLALLRLLHARPAAQAASPVVHARPPLRMLLLLLLLAPCRGVLH